MKIPRSTRSLPILFLAVLYSSSLWAQTPDGSSWTDTDLPAYIRRLSFFGERPDWSADGKRILFVGRSFGDVYEMEVATGAIHALTHHYYHGGYLRALYLSNGDILLVGPRSFSPDNWQEARFRLSELWVLSRKLDGPAIRLGEYCWEGPAVSRHNLKLVWAEHHGVYPVQNRLWQLWMADIDYRSDKPALQNQKIVLDNTAGEVKGQVLEPQNFRPGKEDELTIQSTNGSTEVMGLNVKTGAVVNYSRSPQSYDEPEGIFPDGKVTLVESNKAHPANHAAVDLWMLSLDTTGNWQRLTYFTEGGKFKATNPVVSDDGRFVAFTVARLDEVAGIGHGIYVLDLEKYKMSVEKSKDKK